MFPKLVIGFFLCLGLTGCGPTVEDGVAAFESKQYDKALEIFQKKSGDPVALFHLYEMAYSGLGMPKNEDQATDYLKQAADKGHAQAMSRVGSRFLNNFESQHDVEKGLIYLHKAVQAGYAEANIELGNYFFRKKQVATGLAFLQAAEKTPRGKYALAHRYIGETDGISPDPGKSRKYLEEILDMKGVPQAFVDGARFYLAEFDYYGFGAPRNPSSAANILEPIIDRNVNVKNFYAWLLYRGDGVPADKLKAVRIWMDDEKKLSDGYIINGLAQAYAAGEGVPVDKDKALNLLNKYPTGAGDYWKVILRAQGIAGSDCGTHLFHYGEVQKGALYASIAGQAYLAYAQCVFDRAKKTKKPTNWDVNDAQLWASEAERLGAPQASALRQSILIFKADGGVVIGMTPSQVRSSKWGETSAY
ncbi:tetratricopeptide repeat protein [Comamonas thiooxydans]|uniref:tetratricopeptide repeat protein n=1 Tax=Comamonas thiooxydans TaxID=363952 RepID=UPI0001BB191C|nr:SEL1-like repeat protein [Comamonas thiooxydans]ACY34473.1 sodium-type flagellar motor component [Comamonas thiooxydans]MDO1476862.1 sel1 repeat family protein [Comamonas thiooxydans]